jgi:hypothetical protein
MNISQPVVLVCAGLCLAPLHAQCAEVPVPQCPASVDVQQDIKLPVEGWKTAIAKTNGDAHPLKGIYFSPEEYPSDSCCDIPTEKKTLPRGETVFYFDHVTPKKFDFWFVCGYEDTTVVLARKVPENVARCEVRYSGFPVQPRVISFRCFDAPRKQ